LRYAAAPPARGGGPGPIVPQETERADSAKARNALRRFVPVEKTLDFKVNKTVYERNPHDLSTMLIRKGRCTNRCANDTAAALD
jgi:hypothetical protein